jgi:2-polyprenyl-3-methyl-5-hydroxy-6-metoxy-1,4-benzoquinol methylase
MPEYVRDKLYERLFQPWVLPPPEWSKANEDWVRVDTITRLPWHGRVLDFGAGDGTLAAMVCSRNPLVFRVDLVEHDHTQVTRAMLRWKDWPLFENNKWRENEFDGALCCEVLEHLTEKDAEAVLLDIKKALRPDAQFCVTVPCAGGSREHYPGHIRSFPQFALRDELDRLGFGKVVEAKIDNLWWMAVCLA